MQAMHFKARWSPEVPAAAPAPCCSSLTAIWPASRIPHSVCWRTKESPSWEEEHPWRVGGGDTPEREAYPGLKITPSPQPQNEIHNAEQPPPPKRDTPMDESQTPKRKTPPPKKIHVLRKEHPPNKVRVTHHHKGTPDGERSPLISVFQTTLFPFLHSFSLSFFFSFWALPSSLCPDTPPPPIKWTFEML